MKKLKNNNRGSYSLSKDDTFLLLPVFEDRSSNYCQTQKSNVVAWSCGISLNGHVKGVHYFDVIGKIKN